MIDVQVEKQWQKNADEMRVVEGVNIFKPTIKQDEPVDKLFNEVVDGVLNTEYKEAESVVAFLNGGIVTDLDELLKIVHNRHGTIIRTQTISTDSIRPNKGVIEFLKASRPLNADEIAKFFKK